MEGKSPKDEKPFEERLLSSTRLREKYPGRIPIHINRAKDSRLPPFDKTKYLVPHDFTMGQMIYTVRKRMELKAQQAIFVYIMFNDRQELLAPTSATLGDLYDKYKDADGLLYLQCAGENAFGAEQI